MAKPNWDHIKKAPQTPQEAPQAPQTPEKAPQARHATCRFCGQDIEGFFPYPKGQWRDRGNNTTCPAPLTGFPGPAGGQHSPIGPARKPKADVTPTLEDLERYSKAKR